MYIFLLNAFLRLVSVYEYEQQTAQNRLINIKTFSSQVNQEFLRSLCFEDLSASYKLITQEETIYFLLFA